MSLDTLRIPKASKTQLNQEDNERFLLRLRPNMTTGFQVITQFNQIQIINNPEHSKLWGKMSEYKQKENKEYKEKFDKKQKINTNLNETYNQNLITKENNRQNTKETVVCFIYNKESQDELQKQIRNISKYIQQSTSFVILVNGPKVLDKSFNQLLENFIKNQQIYRKVNFKSHELCYYDTTTIDDTEINWFILQENQDDYRLMMWIYQGILKFFDRKYCFIADLSMSINYSSILDTLEDDRDKFGVQLSYQLDCQTDSLLPNVLGVYYNYLQSCVETGQLGKIKQFHNPFCCIYNWYLIEKHVKDYLNELEDKKDQISMQMNNILPKLMESKQLYLLQCSWLKGQMSKNWNLAQSFKVVSDLQYNISTCNRYIYEKTNFHSFYTFILIALYFIRIFQEKTSLAFNVFVIIFTPYQIFYQNTDSKVLQVLVAVILPYFIIMSLIIFIFLPQQFQIQALKSTKQRIFLHFKKQQQEIKVYPNLEQYQLKEENNSIFLQSLEDDRSINLRLKSTAQSEIQLNGVLLQIQNNNEQYYQSNVQLQIKVGVTDLYKRLFIAFLILTILSVIVFIIDFVITYALDLQNTVKLITFILFFCFLILQMLKYCIAVKEKSYILLLLICYNMIIVQFTKIYNLLNYKKEDPFLYRERVSKLGEYLTLTLAIILTLIIVESQTNYDGYMLLGVFAFYTFINLIDLILQITSALLHKKPIRIHTNDPQERNVLLNNNYRTSNLDIAE